MVHRLNSIRFLGVVGGKALHIPKDGWRAHTFRLFGHSMIMTMHRVALITQRQQQAEIVRVAVRIFKEQMEEMLKRFLNRSPLAVTRSVKVGFELSSGDIFLHAHEALMLDVLNQVLKETGEKVTAKILPGMQSTLAQGYSKTSALLAQTTEVRNNPAFQRRARQLASRITNISDTTRKRLETILKTAVNEQLSVADTVKMIRTKLPKIQANRALTIARTELNHAWSEGAKQAFKESQTLTHVSVIGCESREADRWGTPAYEPYMYRGESTCNAQDVPVADLDKLQWHINHTGTVIPSGFIE